MYVYVYVYIYTYIHTYIHTYIQTYIHTYTYGGRRAFRQLDVHVIGFLAGGGQASFAVACLIVCTRGS